MDKSPALENFMNKMAVMQGKGQPKMSATTMKIGSGGLGPALRAGRANIQFKQREDLIDFIVKGSVNGKAYGVNGVGGGKMPGFGAVLPESDIALVTAEP